MKENPDIFGNYNFQFYDLYRYDVFSFRYLPILAYFLSVANCIIVVVICLYPGWRRDDQAGANVNVKVSEMFG